MSPAPTAVSDCSCVGRAGGAGQEPPSADGTPVSFPVVQSCSLAFKGRLYWHQTSRKGI